MQSGSASLYDNIKKNNLALFQYKNVIVTPKSKQKILSLNFDRGLYANLSVACQPRKGDIGSFFAHENHCYPVLLSEYGRLRKCTEKSDFLKGLEELDSPSFKPPEMEAKVIDGTAFININTPKTPRIFGEYCSVEVMEKVCRILKGVA